MSTQSYKGIELCSCCDEPGIHPWVGVVKSGDGWTHVPVCDACHRDPAHRKRKIKAHFFPAADADAAVAAAGSSNIGGPLR
jgi:hypothetical protein